MSRNPFAPRRHFSPIRQRSMPVASVEQWAKRGLRPSTFPTRLAAPIRVVEVDERGNIIPPTPRRAR